MMLRNADQGRENGGRGKVKVEACRAFEPRFDLGMLMGGVIVDDEMQVESLGRVAVTHL